MYQSKKVLLPDKYYANIRKTFRSIEVQHRHKVSCNLYNLYIYNIILTEINFTY